MSKVVLFLVEGFEDIEAMAPIDVMRRAGIDVDIVSITNDKEVISARNIPVKADKVISKIEFNNYEMIILPGGPGTKNYYNSDLLLEKIKEFASNKKIAAICAAPTIFASLGLLNGKNATCFPACEEELTKAGANVIKEAVVVDGNIITSRAAGTAIDFGLEIIKEIINVDKSNEIKSQIVYK